MKLKQFLYYFITSSAISILLYYLLHPHYGDRVFAAIYRMYLYHYSHPIQYILVATFSFSVVATCFHSVIARSKWAFKIIYILLVFILAILISSPLGGALWHFHDMQAGHFPSNWIEILIEKGFMWGVSAGWFIVLYSIPYNILVALGFAALMCVGTKIKCLNR